MVDKIHISLCLWLAATSCRAQSIQAPPAVDQTLRVISPGRGETDITTIKGSGHSQCDLTHNPQKQRDIASVQEDKKPPLKKAGKGDGKLTILAVGAHMDDVELGIGGILLKAVRAGHRVVVVVAVSDYRTWEATIGREEQCKKDQLALAKRLGYEKRFLDYPYHQFPADNNAKRKIAEIYVELQPDITFVHNTEDHWPDHTNAGIAAKDAVLFAHGYTQDRRIRRCPRVLAFAATPGQTIRFESDFFVDVSSVMAEYMDLLAETDGLLSGRPPQEQYRFEVRNLKSNGVLKLSGHGWQRYCQCVVWADQSGAGVAYAIGLKTLWGPRDGRPLW